MKIISIRDLIEERRQFPQPYPLGISHVSEKNYVSSKIISPDNTIYLILPVAFLQNSKDELLRKQLFEEWHLLAMLEIPFRGFTEQQSNLLVLSKSAPKDIFFSRFFGESGISERLTSTNVQTELSIKIDNINKIDSYFSDLLTKKELKNTQKYRDPYGKDTLKYIYNYHYIKQLEQFLIDWKLPADFEKAKFWKINYKDFNINNLSTIYYEPELIENESNLSKEQTQLLRDLCEILKPKSIKGEVGTVVKTKDFHYPLSIKRLSQSEITNINLQKGDILFSDSFSGSQKFFLINETLAIPVYASSFLVVIRPVSKEITSEYVFLYLQSETVKKYFLRNQSGGFFPRITLSKLRDLPVIIPELITQTKSKNIFDTLFLQNKENLVERINKELFNTLDTSKPVQKEFLKEELDNLRVWKRDLIDKVLTSDFSELEKCKQNKLYKSFLILSGSILEAFLLDWISEIENKNYFDIDEEEYTLGKLIWKKLKQAHPDVFDLELIKMASEIKDKRNLVHPKVYFNSLEAIDSKVCDDVLADLRSIFNKRRTHI